MNNSNVKSALPNTAITSKEVHVGAEWSGSQAPEDPDNWWVDDDTGEYIDARTGERMTSSEGRRRIKASKVGEAA